jgi:hypothetical protein
MPHGVFQQNNQRFVFVCLRVGDSGSLLDKFNSTRSDAPIQQPQLLQQPQLPQQQQLPPQQPAQAVGTVALFCYRCGTRRSSPDAMFCGKCGIKLAM